MVTLDKRVTPQMRERQRLKNKGDMTYPSKREVVVIKTEQKNRAQWKLGLADDLINGSDAPPPIQYGIS